MERRYIVVAGACLTQFTVIGMLFSFGLLFKTFEAEFGWSRMVLSTCSALAFLAMGILAIVAGRLSDRYGPKWVLGISGALFGFGFGLISLINEPWHLFVIFGVFIGLGMSTHDVVTLSTIARWFEGRRGLMSGVVKVGTAFGQIVLPPVTALLIVTLGWRPAVALLGVLAFVLLVIAASGDENPRFKTDAGNRARRVGLDLSAGPQNKSFLAALHHSVLIFPNTDDGPGASGSSWYGSWNDSGQGRTFVVRAGRCQHCGPVGHGGRGRSVWGQKCLYFEFRFVTYKPCGIGRNQRSFAVISDCGALRCYARRLFYLGVSGRGRVFWHAGAWIDLWHYFVLRYPWWVYRTYFGWTGI